jgi:hypothetical protein
MYVPFGHRHCHDGEFRRLILIADEGILAFPEWEQNHFSGESRLVLRATQQHQIVLFFFRILCVGQDVGARARLLV